MTGGREPKSNGWFLPPRFLLFLVAFGVAGGLLFALDARWSQAVIGAFDFAALLFIASLWGLTRDDTPAKMHADAVANDSNRFGVLVITSLVMLVIVTAVAVELPEARALRGRPHVASLLLVLTSLVIAWLFSNLTYALHYAHMYFRDDGVGGLRFPQGKEAPHCPDYWDFAYFALTIGMAFATSDVEIERSDIRRVATVHGAVAFFYNLVVLAFTINVTASG
ncbi:MAG: DUF1345 domain-containing protein [Sphingomonadales bacterium]|nr:DUF1345 domain-containing protein [Sphingomonadales bacterium]